MGYIGLGGGVYDTMFARIGGEIRGWAWYFAGWIWRVYVELSLCSVL